MNHRIVLVVQDFPKLSETFIANKFLGLIERGWDVHIVCARFTPQDWMEFSPLAGNPQLRCRVHPAFPNKPRWLALLLLPAVILWCAIYAPFTTLRYVQLGWRSLKLRVLWRLFLDARLILLKPNMIHFEFGTLAPERMYLKKVLGCKTLVSFRGYDLNFSNLEKTDYYRLVWEQADMLHLLSQDLWRTAVKRGCPEAKPHVLIPPGVDLDVFTPEALPPTAQPEIQDRPMRILSVGRLEWKKGYEYAIQAVRILVDQGIACEYRIIGDGAYYEPLVFARHQLGLEVIVVLVGAQPAQVVKAALEWADIFLHPSLSEGFCNAVIEAQAMGVPVVCSDAGALPENIADGVTGYLTPRRNAQALAEKLARLAIDPALRKRIGAAGRKRVAEHFLIQDQMQQFDQLYRIILGI